MNDGFGDGRDDDTASFDRAFANAMKHGVEDSPSRPSDDALLAYLDGTASPAQQDEVQEALIGSASFRDELLELSRERERLGSPELARAFENATIAEIPPLESLLRTARAGDRFSPARKSPSGSHAKAYGSPNFRALAASILLLALLGYPAYRGQFELPRSRNEALDLRRSNETQVDEIAALRKTEDQQISKIQPLESNLTAATKTGASPWEGGAIEPDYLPSATRDQSPVTTVESRSGQPYLFFAFTPELPDDEPSNALYRIEVTTEGGASRYHCERTAAEFRRLLGGPLGVEILAIPRAAVSRGRYLVRVQRVSPRSREPLQVIPFEVVEK
jgi:hypothetical protein